MKKILLLIISSSLFVTTVHAQDSNRKALFEGKTKIQDPLDLRDPFKKGISSGEREEEEGLVVLDKGKGKRQIDLKTIDPQKIKLVGIIYGQERMALIQPLDSNNKDGKDNVVVKEGASIGPDGAILKAVFPGGIVLVEKFRNVYDQDEYIEWIVPYKTGTNVSLSRETNLGGVLSTIESKKGGSKSRNRDYDESDSGGWPSSKSSTQGATDSGSGESSSAPVKKKLYGQ